MQWASESAGGAGGEVGGPDEERPPPIACVLAQYRVLQKVYKVF